MKPPMRQEVVISSAIPGMFDRFGKPKTTKEVHRARVRSKSNLIITKEGTERNTNIEIDVDPDVKFSVGDSVEYTRIDGTRATGTIVDDEEAVNLTASRVLFRTFYVDGR